MFLLLYFLYLTVYERLLCVGCGSRHKPFHFPGRCWEYKTCCFLLWKATSVKYIFSHLEQLLFIPPENFGFFSSFFVFVALCFLKILQIILACHLCILLFFPVESIGRHHNLVISVLNFRAESRRFFKA